MFFKKKNEPKEFKYKATYKGMCSGNTREFTVAEPNALVNFLQEKDGVYEMYTLISVVPLNETDIKS